MVSSDFTYMRDLKNKTNSEKNKHKGVKPINMEHKLMVAEGMGWGMGTRAEGVREVQASVAGGNTSQG